MKLFSTDIMLFASKLHQFVDDNFGSLNQIKLTCNNKLILSLSDLDLKSFLNVFDVFVIFAKQSASFMRV